MNIIDEKETFSKRLVSSTESNRCTTQEIVFGVDTLDQYSTTGEAVRHHLIITTTKGILTRQFYVRKLPSSGGIYINNTECQVGIATVYVNLKGAAWEKRATFSIAILPEWDNEGYLLAEYSGNRYANTLRSWGGAQTAEVFMDGNLILSERNVSEIHGYFWDPVPDYGVHQVKVRLRATARSTHYVDIVGYLRARQIPGT